MEFLDLHFSFLSRGTTRDKASGMRRTRTSFSLNAGSDYCFSKS